MSDRIGTTKPAMWAKARRSVASFSQSGERIVGLVAALLLMCLIGCGGKSTQQEERSTMPSVPKVPDFQVPPPASFGTDLPSDRAEQTAVVPNARGDPDPNRPTGRLLLTKRSTVMRPKWRQQRMRLPWPR